MDNHSIKSWDKSSELYYHYDCLVWASTMGLPKEWGSYLEEFDWLEAGAADFAFEKLDSLVNEHVLGQIGLLSEAKPTSFLWADERSFTSMGP